MVATEIILLDAAMRNAMPCLYELMCTYSDSVKKTETPQGHR